MPGGNCCINGCPMSRRYKNVSLFKIPARSGEPATNRWRMNMIDTVKKYIKTFDAAFKERLKNNRVYICEKHFTEDQLWHCKYSILNAIINSQFFIVYVIFFSVFYITYQLFLF